MILETTTSPLRLARTFHSHLPGFAPAEATNSAGPHPQYRPLQRKAEPATFEASTLLMRALRANPVLPRDPDLLPESGPAPRATPIGPSHSSPRKLAPPRFYACPEYARSNTTRHSREALRRSRKTRLTMGGLHRVILTFPFFVKRQPGPVSVQSSCLGGRCCSSSRIRPSSVVSGARVSLSLSHQTAVECPPCLTLTHTFAHRRDRQGVPLIR